MLRRYAVGGLYDSALRGSPSLSLPKQSQERFRLLEVSGSRAGVGPFHLDRIVCWNSFSSR
jgi:hypothetical protein